MVIPCAGNLCLRFGVASRALSLVELVDDLRCVRVHRPHANRLPVARRNSATAGVSGSNIERPALVTASARRRPALMCSANLEGQRTRRNLPSEQVGEPAACHGREHALSRRRHYLEQFIRRAGVPVTAPKLVLPGLALA
jgi:hypothetical protein